MAMAVASGSADSYDLDVLAVSDRFRLFNFTRRDDYLAYLWVLRAMDRLRGTHVAQSHTDDVVAVLGELAAAHDGVPSSVGNLRNGWTTCPTTGCCTGLGRVTGREPRGYRNRQSVYQFTELGHRDYTAVEGVLAARLQDANLSRLVFSDIVRDLRGLAEANRDGDGEEIVRRLASLDRMIEDIARRSARFHLTLGDITRSTDASPEMFLRYKHALMAHMSDLWSPTRPIPAAAGPGGRAGQATGLGTLLNRAAEADDRPLMRRGEVLDDWRRRWVGIRAWFVAETGEHSRAAELAAATRAASPA